jgi:hypothetical protein
MTAPHKATPEQWAATEEYANAAIGCHSDSCILELLSRIEALEAAESYRQQDEDAELASDGPDLKSLLIESTGWLVEYEASCQFSKEARKDLQNLVNRCDAAVGDPLTEWDDDSQSTPEQSSAVAAPARGLVEPVVDAITDSAAGYGTADEPARAAILAVAKWFDAIGYGATASILRQEVQRHG